MNSGNQSPERLFEAALHLTNPAQRSAFLDGACAGDAQLRQRVEALLQDYEQAGQFLEQPPAAFSTDALGATARMIPLTEKPGDKIGRYKLREQIGEGGCGVVYMAEQQEPVRRRVALKIIKLGMDTKQVVGRFEAERQALALMDHPNIAKVLDAGATDTGRPYFVMELVRGISITDYCDQNNLSTEERLRLFIQVCHAIQHAHQKGIIHRDIKPSNVLVALHDGVPVPKIIDFGIAKATTDQRLTDKTIYTAFEQFIGTPAYMSPEQAEMSGLDIDTRSDIYSLGVLLYELLTGETPFDSKMLLQAGLDQMRRIIREQEPPQPSTRLSTLNDADLAQIAKRRHAEPPKLISGIRGDLDWIAMKCLEKDRTRRFETVSALAMDVKRHLDNEIVVARPPSQRYRLQKLIKRNKFAVVGSGVVAVVVVLGVILWILLLHKEGEARQLRQEAEVQRLEKQAHDFEGEGKPAEAEAAYRKMLAIQTSLLGIASSDTRQTFLNLVAVLESQNKLPALETVYLEALGNLRRVSTLNVHSNMTDCLLGLGSVLERQSKLPEAENSYREALEIRRKFLGSDSLEVADCWDNLARVLDHQGKLAKQEAACRQAVEIRRKALGNNHLSVATSLYDLGWALWQRHNFDEAEERQREALAIRRKLLGDKHQAVAWSLRALAWVLRDQTKLLQAESMEHQALDLAKNLEGTDFPDQASCLTDLADILKRQNKLPEAETAYREALEVRRKSLGDWHSDVASTLSGLEDLLLLQRKYPQGEELLNELLPPAAENQPQSAGLLRVRANFHGRRGQWQAAAFDLARVVESDPRNLWNRLELAALLVETGDLAGYRSQRQAMLTQFGATQEPSSAEQVAKACLLLPATKTDSEAASRLAEVAVAIGKEGAWVAYYQFAKSLAEYRQGRFDSAAEWARKALSNQEIDSQRDVQACMVLAMASHQLGQGDEARAALAKGGKIAETRLPKLDSGDLGPNWHDWIIAQILLREAKMLMESGSKAGHETK